MGKRGLVLWQMVCPEGYYSTIHIARKIIIIENMAPQYVDNFPFR